jgi:PIN domain nuclease of toxin-antitoxin system
VNLLLDTHILLWAAGQPDRLSEKCKILLLNPSNNLNFSAASLWEISIKYSLGRSDFNVDPGL